MKTTKKIKLGKVLEKLTQRHYQQVQARFDMSQDFCDNDICVLELNSSRYKRNNFLILKNNWNFFAMFYLCLVATVRKLIST